MTETSLGTLAIGVGIMASNLYFNPAPHSNDGMVARHAPLIDYKLLPSTYGVHADIFAASQLLDIRRPSLESFYSTLLSKQERLGAEFEQALFDNLWELYAR
jgi:hypothetical protein